MTAGAHVYHFFRRDIAFVRICKSASTTLLHSIFAGEPHTVSYAEMPDAGRSLAIIRHPLTRFRSALDMFRERVPDLTVQRVLEVLADDGIAPDNADPENILGSLRLHFLPMSDPRCCLDQVARLFRFETLSEDWEEIAHFAGCATVPNRRRCHATKSPSSVLPADEAQIRAYFAEDFMRFGYD